MGVIWFGGVSSADVGFVVEYFPNYATPEKDYEIEHVPGRNGDIVVDKGSYKNVTRSYQIAAISDQVYFPELVNRISEWLHAASGYARLEDTYEPDYYRLALYREPTSFTNILMRAGRATINFDCKPQRFLKSGEIVYQNPISLTNPTVHTALPLITVYGTGEGVLTVGDYIVTISAISGSITIDSALQDAYSGTANRNADITLSNGFPKFAPGLTAISWSGGITDVEVTPRWWTL